MAFRLRNILRFTIICFAFVLLHTACSVLLGTNEPKEIIRNHSSFISIPVEQPKDSIDIRVGTFLGNEKRNYYGDSCGNKLDVIWKCFLGTGTTIVNAEKGIEQWSGAGWTGQPLVVKENDKTFLIQGAFDHNLKKINAATGEIVWNYMYDDILKGTGTIWKNDSAKDPLNRMVILQGSRKGVENSMCSPVASSYRAVSLFTGKELWRYNVQHTESYSRDVDASALILNDTAYIGLENGKFIRFDPGREVENDDTVNHPRVFQECMLYADGDAARHGGNLVTESSPSRIGDHLYITAGSGHVYGYDLNKKIIDWDFYIGSDMDGTPVVTADSCLLIAVEKQYIAGRGGIFKLNPAKDPEHCVEWYFPTGDNHFSSWDGGVIGSVCVNDHYNDGRGKHLAAFTGIDGMLNVVAYDRINTDSTVIGPDGKTEYPVPTLVFSQRIGPSISTPIFTGDKLIAAGYSGIHLFHYDFSGTFTSLDFHAGIFEASPVADNGRIYIASRDGFLYCFGEGVPETQTMIAATAPPKEKIIPVIQPKKKLPWGNANDFSLIAGVFRNKNNATTFVKVWRERGMIAEVIANKDLYYVSIASGTSLEEMTSLAVDVQVKYGADCWVSAEIR